MEKKTFVAIIKAIQDQKAREGKFAEAITDAFVKVAKEESDFRTSDSYLPPTNKMVDDLTNALAYDFITPCQSYEGALDLINYFMYELPLMHYKFMEPVDPEKDTFVQHAVPAYVEKNGVKIPLTTPEELYDALILCGKPGNCSTVAPEKELASAVLVEPDTKKFEPITRGELIAQIKEMVAGKIDVKPEKITMANKLREDLGLDAIDMVDLMYETEHTFGPAFWEGVESDWQQVVTIEDVVELVWGRLTGWKK